MFIPFIIKVLYIYLIGLTLAVLEIQIEGRRGWAEKLPTWRPGPNNPLGRWWRQFFKKDLTGYHAALNFFLLLLMHLPFIWFWTWSWPEELETLAFFALLTVFWDFLWFVLNPNHSLRDFNKNNIWWHRHWLGKFPVDYYLGVLITIILFIPLIVLDPVVYSLKLLILLGGVMFLTLTTVLSYPKAY